MKRVIIAISILILSVSLYGQKVGYMNSQTVLAQISEYTSAQQTLEALSKQYQEYLSKESAKVDEAYRKYQAERGTLTETQKRERENQIIEMERGVKEKQNEYFGEKGVMATKSEELLAPIKAKVDGAVKKVASLFGYTLILDISSLQGVIYYDEESDLSLEIIKHL